MKILITIITAAGLAAGAQASAHLKTIYQVEQSPFASYIAQKVGDILTVIVNEDAQTVDDGGVSLKKDDNIKATLKKLFLPGFKTSTGFDDAMAGGDTPGLELESSTDFKSEGKNSSKHRFTTKLQVRIIEKVRDGEFVIRGQRLVNINGKDKKIFVSGVVRQRDINANNTIRSHQIADATIEIDGEFFRKNGRPSMFTKIFNYIF